ncbi:hypothetical protein VZ95_20320 [Elstera litoralis]|uniref:Uncharacterized protein n=1 Tax=Elstera litoralis TaxID=552518 RepID=A0A0F3INE0_9PROT|nr:hypothetical protein VZ95_20320 [Elstera litoralis]
MDGFVRRVILLVTKLLPVSLDSRNRRNLIVLLVIAKFVMVIQITLLNPFKAASKVISSLYRSSEIHHRGMIFRTVYRSTVKPSSVLTSHT